MIEHVNPVSDADCERCEQKDLASKMLKQNESLRQRLRELEASDADKERYTIELHNRAKEAEEQNAQLQAEARALRSALDSVYPLVAGRVLQLKDAGEVMAMEQWNTECIKIIQALSSKRRALTTGENARLWEELKQAQAEAGAMREAAEKLVNYAKTKGADGPGFCNHVIPASMINELHQALSPSAGVALFEKIRRLRGLMKAYYDLARQVLEDLPWNWGDKVVDGQISLTVDANALDALIACIDSTTMEDILDSPGSPMKEESPITWDGLTIEQRTAAAQKIFSVFAHLIRNGACSYRYLIYDHLGFPPSCYGPLLEGMIVTNFISDYVDAKEGE